MSVQIEDIIRGLATGAYIRRVGSQFRSLYRFDGLMQVEATPTEYAAFGVSRGVRLCHSQEINWLGRKWPVILAFK
jgi:hypothetical protein